MFSINKKYLLSQCCILEFALKILVFGIQESQLLPIPLFDAVHFRHEVTIHVVFGAPSQIGTGWAPAISKKNNFSWINRAGENFAAEVTAPAGSTCFFAVD